MLKKYKMEVDMLHKFGTCLISKNGKWYIQKQDIPQLIEELRGIGVGTHVEYYGYEQRYTLETRERYLINIKEE